MSLIDITEKEELDEVMSRSCTKLNVVYFWAPWCQPCNAIGPKFVSLVDQFPTVQFIRVNVDDAGELSDEFNIGYAPSFIFLKLGRQLDSYHGIDEHELKAMIDKYK